MPVTTMLCDRLTPPASSLVIPHCRCPGTVQCYCNKVTDGCPSKVVCAPNCEKYGDCGDYGDFSEYKACTAKDSPDFRPVKRRTMALTQTSEKKHDGFDTD